MVVCCCTWGVQAARINRGIARNIIIRHRLISFPGRFFRRVVGKRVVMGILV
jgi:hypothetical protein